MPLVAVRLQWGHSTFSDVVVVSWVGAGWVLLRLSGDIN